MKPEMERLLERLQTGWQPKSDEIDMRIAQRRLDDWQFWQSRPPGMPPLLLCGWLREDPTAWPTVTEEVIWIDAELRWALCDDGTFWWLDGS